MMTHHIAVKSEPTVDKACLHAVLQQAVDHEKPRGGLKFIHTLHDNIAIVEAVRCPGLLGDRKPELKAPTVTSNWQCRSAIPATLVISSAQGTVTGAAPC